MIRNLTATLVFSVAIVIIGATTVPASAQAEYCTESMKCLNQDKNYGEIARSIEKTVGNESATRVRKAFLQAKKAFHEARQEIQAIKKGDASPDEDVPCFFCDDEEDSDDDFQEEDGPELEG